MIGMSTASFHIQKAGNDHVGPPLDLECDRSKLSVILIVAARTMFSDMAILQNLVLLEGSNPLPCHLVNFAAVLEGV